MMKLVGGASLATVLGTAAILGGCASRGDVEQAQATANQALGTAQQAMSAAQQAQMTASNAQQSAEAARTAANTPPPGGERD